MNADFDSWRRVHSLKVRPHAVRTQEGELFVLREIAGFVLPFLFSRSRSFGFCGMKIDGRWAIAFPRWANRPAGGNVGR